VAVEEVAVASAVVEVVLEVVALGALAVVAEVGVVPVEVGNIVNCNFMK
jgi:hypothetical protein